MSPNLTHERGLVGKDIDECARAESGRSDEPREAQGDRPGRRGRVDGRQLSASQTNLEALPPVRSERVSACQRRALLEPEQACRVSPKGVSQDSREVRRPGGSPVRANSGG